MEVDGMGPVKTMKSSRNHVSESECIVYRSPHRAPRQEVQPSSKRQSRAIDDLLIRHLFKEQRLPQSFHHLERRGGGTVRRLPRGLRAVILQGLDRPYTVLDTVYIYIYHAIAFA